MGRKGKRKHRGKTEKKLKIEKYVAQYSDVESSQAPCRLEPGCC
jgi:hypothetical protein